jgi:type 1 glutamine amidotransferase
MHMPTKYLASIILCCTMLLTVAHQSTVSAEDAAPKTKFKGLIITGGCCHDYENQKKILSEGLAQRLSITCDVVHEGGESRDHKISVYSNPDWAKGYDVIIHNECFGAIDDPLFIRGIVNAHTAGTPAVFIHCSLHSYRAAKDGAEPWREIIGITSTSHEKARPLTVKNLMIDHPVMKGFPAEWKTPVDELYKVEKTWHGCTPLAQAYGEETKKDHTLIWVNEVDKTRFFGTSLGHGNQTMVAPEFLDVVGRGTLWTLNQLQDDGTASKGYEGTGVKEIPLPEVIKKPVVDPKMTPAK